MDLRRDAYKVLHKDSGRTVARTTLSKEITKPIAVRVSSYRRSKWKRNEREENEGGEVGISKLIPQ